MDYLSPRRLRVRVTDSLGTLACGTTQTRNGSVSQTEPRQKAQQTRLDRKLGGEVTKVQHPLVTYPSTNRIIKIV